MVRGRSSNLLNTIREIGAEEVEGVVENCGIRHSDLSIINNDWGICTCPVIPGHEVISRVANSPQAKGRQSDKPWASAGVLRAACIVINACRQSEPLRSECPDHRRALRACACNGHGRSCYPTGLTLQMSVTSNRPRPNGTPIAPSATAPSRHVISRHMTADPYFWS